MRAVFVDANDTLAAVTEKLLGVANLPVGINRNLLLNDETKRFLSRQRIAQMRRAAF